MSPKLRFRLRFRLLALLLACTARPALALAAETAAEQVPSASASELTGDCGGLRSKLSKGGLDLTGGYTNETATNVSGGLHHDAAQTGQFSLGVTGDAQKLFGIEGGTFQATVTYRQGDNLVSRAGLNTLLQVQEVYGRGETTRLTEFWWDQQLGGGVDVKFGRLPAGGDFSSFSCDYMNGSFCGAPVGNIAGDFWYNWPVSQWAARVRVQHGDLYAQAGVYEVNPKNLDNGFTLGHFSGAAGVMTPVEAGLHTRFGPNGLPGLYQIGGWFSSARAPDVLLGADGEPAVLAGSTMLERSGRYGGFVILRQQLTGTAAPDAVKGPQTKVGLSAFLTVTQTDRQTETIDNQITAGLRYLGLFASRPNDMIQLGVARTHVNTRAADLDGLQSPTGERPGSEYELEADYGVQVLPWLNVQPNVQYVVNPGGYADRPDAVVIGVKTAVTF